MGEFELIRRYFSSLAGEASSPSLVLGPGDDCAIQRVPSGHDLVFSLDTLVEGVHFPVGYDPVHLGWRALAAAASDLAAMGARPVCFTLALTLPHADPKWLQGFADGLKQAAGRFGLALAGGDTTRGPLTLSLQVHGEVPQGQGILRSGARPGDLVAVTGALGAAGAALAYLDVLQPTADQEAILRCYHRPQPRLDLGVQLRGLASAAIDISDGLLADLEHILDASCVGAELDVAAVPVSAALVRLVGKGEALRLALQAGDDYELCVTISPDVWTRMSPLLQKELTIIGKVNEGQGITGPGVSAKAHGYDHFRSAT